MIKKRKPHLSLLLLIAILAITACSNSTTPKFDITSTSLRDDGKWLSIITKSKGENMSPQLSWTPVENATCYGIYMFDTSAGNWLHWIAKDVKETELKMGAKIDNSKYVGPYPPSGTHTYEITIFAFKASPDAYPGIFDSKNQDLDRIISILDTSNGETGNIIAKSILSGTYKSEDIVDLR